MKELAGCNALVTGAGGGLGHYIARALAAEGVNLVLSDVPGADVSALAEELRARGVRVAESAADLAVADERAGLVAAAESALGPLDILVNNAGLEFSSEFHAAMVEQIELITQVNLTAVMHLTRLVLPGMLERRRGHVVNIASMAGKVPAPFLATYCATKHGVVGFTHSLRAEIGAEPVGVSAICPSFIGKAGMYGRVEHLVSDPPPEVQTMPPEAVGDAVVSAIRDNRAEVLVQKGPGRSLIALFALAPATGIGLLRRRRRVFAFAREFSAAREREGI